jgi:hypothetical protein
MLFLSPLRSTQSSSLVSLISLLAPLPVADCVRSLHSPVMPVQQLAQLPWEPARQSARVLADALAVAPSHVWPSGQSLHSLLRTYLVSAHLAVSSPFPPSR